MTTSSNDSFLADIGRLVLWVFGIVFLVMTIGIDDELLARIFRASIATFFLGIVISMKLKRWRPNWKAWFWTTRVIAILGGFVAASLKLYGLL